MSKDKKKVEKRIKKLIKFCEQTPPDKFSARNQGEAVHQRYSSPILSGLLGYLPQIFPKKFQWHLTRARSLKTYPVFNGFDAYRGAASHTDTILSFAKLLGIRPSVARTILQANREQALRVLNIIKSMPLTMCQKDQHD